MRRGIVIVNPSLPDTICLQLADAGWQAVAVSYCHSVLEPIAGHPDLQICCLYDEVVVYPHLPLSLKKTITDNGYRLIDGDSIPGRIYPADVPYNAVLIEKFFFHHASHTDPILRRQVETRGFTAVHVNQGYTGCSVLQVSANALITADTGIAMQAEKHGLNVLLIRSGYVNLSGMDTGFFGGTGGWDGEDSVYVCGSIDAHPDTDAVCRFIHAHNKRLICLGDNQLADYGSLLFLPLRA